MQLLNPRDLRDARINDVFVESPSRLLLHLKDGRAVSAQRTRTPASRSR